VSIINKYNRNLLAPCYHIILDNPWETNKDVKDTLKLIFELPKPFWLKIASLTFYPGTFLYHKAAKDGFIKDEFNDIYRKPFSITRGSYLNYLVYLSGHNSFPRWILKGLSNNKIVGALDKEYLRGVYSRLHNLTEIGYKISRGIRSILTGDIVRLRLYLRRFKNFIINHGRTTADV